MRLDQYTAEKYPELSRSYIAKLIDDGQVLVNGAASKPGYRLREHDEVRMIFDLNELQKIEEIDLPILYEDENVLVVDKPAGVISHARGKFWNEASVASFVRQKTGQEGERAGIVHRLDRVTSGVMICAKNAETLSYLQKQFSNRSVKKTYIAIVIGHLKPEEAIIDMPIARHPSKPQVFHSHESGKLARTHYIVQRQLKGYDVVELIPETGRTHQLRVHLNEVGHPIVGDHLYNGGEAERLFLHAQTLEITIPGGERRVFTSPIPKSFEIFEEKHRGSR